MNLAREMALRAEVPFYNYVTHAHCTYGARLARATAEGDMHTHDIGVMIIITSN